ncbi:unnamed protein product [Notodromas monacha]|uniref:Uncharacterized protein n=1 Tax=Notodromas monacha TaxID=399045 RepID=A0A7R9GI39_9CRUS|nr:unnamed protein product [Notodromas monacha]CAG0922020.1 unnamed protein product [Notodromas monacha]
MGLRLAVAGPCRGTHCRPLERLPAQQGLPAAAFEFSVVLSIAGTGVSFGQVQYNPHFEKVVSSKEKPGWNLKCSRSATTKMDFLACAAIGLGGGALAIITAPATLAAVGFGAGGVLAGSIAAGVHSAILQKAVLLHLRRVQVLVDLALLPRSSLGLLSFSAIAAAAAMGTGGLAIVGAPLVLAAVGFTAKGIAAGSMAAGVQAGIGNVAAGSVFAQWLLGCRLELVTSQQAVFLPLRRVRVLLDLALLLQQLLEQLVQLLVLRQQP